MHEEVKFRLLAMSMDNANSMLPAMSVPPGAGMSMPPGAGMSMPLPAGEMSMPMDAGMSFPLDAGMSFPMDAGMSMPLDAGMMSLDLTMSMAVPADTDEDAACDESNPSTTVSKSFEVDGPVGILSDILSAAVQEDFTLCPSSIRMLWETERDVQEESVVLGVKVKSVSANDGASCSTGADDDCEVADAEFEVIHKEGSSSQAATDEFNAKLSARLAEVDGVRERGDTTSSPDSSSTETKPAGVDGSSSDRGLGGGEKAATIICSVAVVAVALVLVQRKLSKKRDDDKSVASMSTSQTPSAYNSSNSIF